MKEKKYRIGNVAVTVLGFFAVVADLLTPVPVLGSAIGPIFWVIAGIYFWYAGLGLLNWRKLVPTLISFVAELIPAIQALPTIAAAVAIIIAVSRAEDKTGFKILPTKNKPGFTPPRLNRLPANQEGVRAPRNKPGEEISLAE